MKLTIDIPDEFVAKANQQLDALHIPRNHLAEVFGNQLINSGVEEERGLMLCNYVFPDRSAAALAASAYFDEALGEPTQDVSFLDELGNVVTEVFENPLCDEMPRVLDLIRALDEQSENDEEAA